MYRRATSYIKFIDSETRTLELKSKAQTKIYLSRKREVDIRTYIYM